jgi:BASS family bile acid:Na+ symporter
MPAGVLESVLRAAVLVFMVGSLAGAGLGLTLRQALAPLKHGGFVVRTLVVSWLVCPAVALLLLRVVPLARPYATGLLLLSLVPCAPFLPGVAARARGNPSYVAAFILLSALGTVVIMPLAVPRTITGLTADPLTIARPLLLFVLLPLVVGLGARAFDPRWADRARPLVTMLTNVAGCIAFLLLVVIHGRGVIDAVGSYAIATQLLFVGGVTVAAHLIGAGLADEERSVLTIGICTRNLGAALAPLANLDTDPRAVVMIAIGAPVTLVLSALTARWLARRGGQSGHPLQSHPAVAESSSV